jgi:hypothetical protein
MYSNSIGAAILSGIAKENFHVYTTEDTPVDVGLLTSD